MRKASSWHLTYKIEGKPRTVYVPVDMVEEVRLGEDLTVTCSENTVHHANRVMTADVEKILLKMVRRLIDMRMLDGLYAVEPVFERCKEYGWTFIITMKEGRQPTAFDEAVQTMLMSPSHVWKGKHMGEDGMVEQTARWSEQVPVSGHPLGVIFLGQIAPHAATL